MNDPSPTADREFFHSRLIDAPPGRVFPAFSDPARLARWWGPNGFGSTFHEFDLRPGGAWRFVMHGPDGQDSPNENLFREVLAPERVVLEHLSQDHHFVMTITFADRAVGHRVRRSAGCRCGVLALAARCAGACARVAGRR